MRAVVLFGFLFLIFVLGCSDAMNDKDYSHAWRAAVLEYRKLPKNPGDPKFGDGSLESQARAAKEISADLRAIGKSLKDLKAPEPLKQLHEETYLFYRGQADAYSGYSEALDSGDGNKVAIAGERLNKFAGERQALIAGLIDKLGTKAYLFRESWKSVLKDIPAKN